MDQRSVSQLKKCGFVNVEYPQELRGAVEKAVGSWKKFCALPEDVRLQFPYSNNSGAGVGYELKKTPGKTLDLKEDFHVTLGSEDYLKKNALALGDTAAMQFVIDAEKLIATMTPLIVGFAKQMEKEFVLDEFANEVAASQQDHWVVRFLHYFGDRKVGEEIATSHADKSGFTLHLYESDPGLEYLTLDKEWLPMPVSESETAIIPGMRGQLKSQNKLKATFHRVVATPHTAIHGRFSVVCFVHPKDTPEYDKSRAGRLQEFPPGFNYDMPFEDFSKLFITKK